MRGEIVGITGPTITINSIFESPAGASFPVGSSLDVVNEVTFDSPSSGSGVTRDSGNGPVLLMSNSTFTLSYIDNSGSTISLPLSALEIENDLAKVNLTVSVTGDAPLKDGSDYVATAQQRISIRNLVLN